jgi:hypothetical protein
MLETKLIVGRFINLSIPQPPAPAYANGAFVTVPVQDCYLKESTGVFTKTSAVEQAVGPKLHRRFKWLPWLPGAISTVALVGTDVLTGPMGGCWLITYRKANGVPHAAHLGTDVADATRSAAVKTAWNNFARANLGDVIGGFNPLRDWVGSFPAQQGEDSREKIFGLFTTTNDYYIIFTYQQGTTTLLRIAGVQRVPSVSIPSLQLIT